jgi:hypothetical protein
MSNVVRRILAGAVFCVAAHAITPAALAEGAIAIGASGNFAKDGFAFGGAFNKASTEEASQQALETCHKYEGAPKMAAICRVVMTFSQECYALAFDPKAGTPGVGWAISDDKVKAEERAQKNCEVTAGPGRRDFCKVNQSACDTHN